MFWEVGVCLLLHPYHRKSGAMFWPPQGISWITLVFHRLYKPCGTNNWVAMASGIQMWVQHLYPLFGMRVPGLTMHGVTIKQCGMIGMNLKNGLPKLGRLLLQLESNLVPLTRGWMMWPILHWLRPWRPRNRLSHWPLKHVALGRRPNRPHSSCDVTAALENLVVVHHPQIQFVVIFAVAPIFKKIVLTNITHLFVRAMVRVCLKLNSMHT